MLATLLNYMDRQALSQYATDLKAEYNLDDARYGQVEAYFSWAFAVGSIGFGLLADSIGPRRLYPVVLLGWSVAGLATPLMANPDITAHFEGPSDDPGAGPFRWLLLCRTVLGLFEAGHWPCALITARQILIAKDRPLGNGLLQSGATVGAVTIPFYVMVVRHLGGGWGVVFQTIGAAGLLWVPIWLVLVRRGDLDGPPASAAGVPVSAPDPTGWVFARMCVVLLAVVGSITVSWQFLRAWLPKYLKESQGFSPDETDVAVAGYYIVAEIGCLLAGVMVKWLVSRGFGVHSARVRGFAVFSVIAAAAALVPVVGGGWIGVGVLWLAGAGILGLHPYYYALAQELPAKSMGALSGMIAAVGWFVAGFVQKELGAQIKATNSYDVGLVIAGLAPLLGLIALVVLWKSEGAPRASALG